MSDILVFSNSSISSDLEILIKDLNLEIVDNKNTAIIGSSSSGKTTLLKAIAGIFPATNLEKKNKNSIRVLINLPKSSNTVQDLLIKQKEEKFLNELLDEFSIRKYLNTKLMKLPKETLILVYILELIMEKPKLIVLDDFFSHLKLDYKLKLLNWCQKLKITLMIVMSDIEDTLYMDNIIVMHKGKVLINDEKMAVYENEKLLNKLGIGLPFVVDLSRQLMYYGLVEEIYLTKESLVEKLWK